MFGNDKKKHDLSKYFLFYLCFHIQATPKSCKSISINYLEG